LIIPLNEALVMNSLLAASRDFVDAF
jgi:hypothetical protein